MRIRRRPALAALVAIAAAATVAAAQPGAGRPPPPPDHLLPAALPIDHAPIEIVRGDPIATAHVEERQVSLVGCVPRGRLIRARVSLRWNAGGTIRGATVSGGSAAFNRCAARVLRGVLTIPPPRTGAGRVVLDLRRGAPPPVAATVDIHRCTIAADCSLHFRVSACVASDPVAVNALDPAAVRATYPVRRIECAMGGPQYMELLMANEGRWSTACERSRCVVHDAGPRPTGPGGLEL